MKGNCIDRYVFFRYSHSGSDAGTCSAATSASTFDGTVFSVCPSSAFTLSACVGASFLPSSLVALICTTNRIAFNSFSYGLLALNGSSEPRSGCTMARVLRVTSLLLLSFSALASLNVLFVHTVRLLMCLNAVPALATRLADAMELADCTHSDKLVLDGLIRVESIFIKNIHSTYAPCRA